MNQLDDVVYGATDRFRRSSKRRRQSICPSQYLQRVIDVLVMTQKQLPMLQKVPRTVEIPQVPEERTSECIVGQFIDVPVCQILDETTAAAKLAHMSEFNNGRSSKLWTCQWLRRDRSTTTGSWMCQLSCDAKCPPSSRHSNQWKFHHSLSFPTALMKCHLRGNAKYQSSRQPRRQSKFFTFSLLIEFMTCQSENWWTCNRHSAWTRSWNASCDATTDSRGPENTEDGGNHTNPVHQREWWMFP